MYTHIRVLYEAQRFILIFDYYYECFTLNILYVSAYYLIRMYIHDAFFSSVICAVLHIAVLTLHLCRNLPDRLEFCREWFRVNFSRLTVISNWSKYIYILHINHSFKYLTTKHSGNINLATLEKLSQIIISYIYRISSEA